MPARDVAERSADAMVTRDEVAEFFNVSPRTVEGWAYRKVGPPYRRIGFKGTRYRWGDVLNWFEAQTYDGASMPGHKV